MFAAASGPRSRGPVRVPPSGAGIEAGRTRLAHAMQGLHYGLAARIHHNEGDMDMTLQLCRTAKGQEEIFRLGHTLRPRQRQILFTVGNGISFDELRSRLPDCAELETMVNDLLRSGFIQALRNMAGASAPGRSDAARAVPAQTPAQFRCVHTYVLDFMAALIGTKSPAYRKMSEVRDLEDFNAILPMCREVVAAVASPHQAGEMEAEVAKRMAG